MAARDCATFLEAFAELAESQSDADALVHGDRTLTYGALYAELRRRIEDYGAAFRTDNNMAVVFDDPVEFVLDAHALMALKKFALLLPREITDWELERVLQTAPCELIISSRFSCSTGAIGRRNFKRLPVEQRSDCSRKGIGYLTSGTTGQQKVALRTESALLSEAKAMRLHLELSRERRMGAIIPLQHSFGFGVFALAALFSGAAVHVFDNMPPSALLKEFSSSGIDLVPLVPAQLRVLTTGSKIPAHQALSVLSAGSPLDAKTAALAGEQLGCRIGQVYGTTETGIMTVAPPGSDFAQVGRPCAHVKLRLSPMPLEWESECDQQGIVCVSSDALFSGYVTGHTLDSSALHGKEYSTGDRARFVGAELQLLGRISAAINVAGLKIGPEEIEAALMEYPEIQFALVRGVDDEVAYQRIKAYVSPENVDLVRLRKFCEERLSSARRPYYFQAVPQLSTTASGKIIRDQVIPN